MYERMRAASQYTIDDGDHECSFVSQCCYCSMQCGIDLHTDVNNPSSVRISGNTTSPVSKGKLCQKGALSFEHVNHRERLTTPLRRRKGQLEPCSWTEALEEIADRFKSIQNKHGHSAVGVYGGGSLTNEKTYLLGKFARVALRTPNIDYNGRYCMSSAAAAMNRAFGIDRGLPFPLEDIEQADCILLVGANVAECQPVMLPYFRAAQKRGAVLIVIDPRFTPTAKLANIHIAIHPGTDAWLMNGILHVLVRDGLIDQQFILERTVGFDEVCADIHQYDPNRVAAITDVDPKRIEQLARMIASKRTMILSARGIEQRSSGVDQVLSCINVVLATGNIGKVGTGYGAITGQANGQGGREHGQKADQLPGYRFIDDPDDRAYIAKIWQIPEQQLPKAGLSAYEMFEEIENGSIKGLFILASNPLVSSPNCHFVKTAFGALDTLVVVDLFLSETASVADFVLPGSSWSEEEGTTTNLEGRVLLRNAANKPPGSALEDWKILCLVAEKFGYGPLFSYQDVEDIFNELCLATKGARADYSGLTYEKLTLQNSAAIWPYPAGASDGTKRMFTDSFAHKDGRARFIPVIPRRPAEMPDPEYPYYLTTGRIIQHYLTGSLTRRTFPLNDRCKDPFAELHPDVAVRHGIKDGTDIVLESRRGRIQVKAKITPAARPDTIFVPFHWEYEKCINQLTSSALDPVSKMPEFKSCAIRILTEPNSNERGA